MSGSTLLKLRVKPGAKRNALLGRHGEALKLSVTAPPDKGKANRAVIELLAEALDLPASAIEIVGGAGSRDKTVRIEGDPAAVAALLDG